MEKKEVFSACVVLPTYNEAGNIKNTLDKIFSNNSKYLIKVLVVDDNSPDKTHEIVKNYQKKNKRVYLLIRKNKQGLGAAYIAGMNYALEKIPSNAFIEMDADGQHNPKDIPRLLKEIENGFDFVIGSRYVEGGNMPENWGIKRKLLSSLAGYVSKIGLGLGKIKDPSGGFRAIRSESLKKININSLDVKGYAFQVALLESAVKNKLKIKEIPISFLERKTGESKMALRDIMEGWKIIFKIRKKRLYEKLGG